MKRFFAALLAVSCSTTTPVEPAPIDVPLPPPEPLPVLRTPAPPMPQGHPDVTSLSTPSAAPRRLTIDQLERAIDDVANLPRGTVKLPAALAVTLGKPDYGRVTEETLEPSPLFMKFLVDIGVGACLNISEYEPSRPKAERLMTRFDTKEENLAFMVLRFTGLEGAPAAPLIERLQTVHSTASSSRRPRAGYEAVCLALITSPEFLLF